MTRNYGRKKVNSADAAFSGMVLVHALIQRGIKLNSK